METLRNLINQNWIGVAVGIIAGLIISYIFYRLSRIRLGMAAQKRSFSVIAPGPQIKPSEIEILFRGIKVPRVTLSIVVIWNSGNTTIEGSRIVAADRLRIVVPEGSQIIDVRQRVTREANGFNTAIKPDHLNELDCTFDYLDPSDGARLTLLHSGEPQIKVLGTLRGIPQGIEDLGPLQGPKQDKILLSINIFQLIIGVVGVLYFLLMLKLAESTSLKIFGFIVLLFGSFAIWSSIKDILAERRRIPKDLAAKESD